MVGAGKSAAAAVAAVLIDNRPCPLLHGREGNTASASVRVNAPREISLPIPHVFARAAEGHVIGRVGCNAVGCRRWGAWAKHG